MRAEIVEVRAATLFHAYFRLHALLRLSGLAAAGADLAAALSVRLIVGELWTDRKLTCRFVPERGAIEIVLEALVDRAAFPQHATLELACEGRMARLPVTRLMEQGRASAARSLNRSFEDAMAEATARAPGRRPRLLDLGGRARSGVERRLHYPQCAVTTFDILPDPSVDVVGDAHELSRHFPPQAFDFVLCISVFEHLLMPWRVALEINRVLRSGGLALIHTHQTLGMHDLPWDFWRFSDTSWQGLFNHRTGFEIVATALDGFMHVVPAFWTPRHAGAEASGGFEGSTVLVRRTGATDLTWNVRLSEVLDTGYPQGRNG